MANNLPRVIVKSIQSADSIIVRGQPKGGPPPEKQINLAFINAPRVARRMPDGTYSVDEPHAWAAREWLREKLIGKEVSFQVEYKIPFAGSQRDFAIVYLNGENINDSMVSLGLAEVSKRAQNKDNPEVLRMSELEENAKAQQLGKWSSEKPSTRTFIPEIEDGQKLVNKSFSGIVEHVRDGSTLRIGLLLSTSGNDVIYQMASVQLAGIRCPMANEPFGEEARFFTEVRLLQREVKVQVQQFFAGDKNSSLTAVVTYLGKDIAEFLVREGYAKLFDRTLVMAADPKALRAAEQEAKSKRLRIWKDFKHVQAPPKPITDVFDAKVIEIVNADAVMIQHVDTKVIQKIHLASIRPPRLEQKVDEEGNVIQQHLDRKTFRPLYDIPFMFEAREFLRKKLVGKVCKIKIDYIQPKSEQFPEKTCCTITQDGQNVAEQLLSRGLVSLVKYRGDDDQRASDYDAFLAAEQRAQKANKGIHSNKPESGLVRIVDLSLDMAKSKSFAPFLTKQGLRRDAVVEYVFPSATKVKLYIPKENCLINLNLGGVNPIKPGEAISAEAQTFAKLRVLQREVSVEIETQDKIGNYIGSVYFDKTLNLANELVKAGFLSIREYAPKQDLINSMKEAQNAHRGIWKDWTPEDPAAALSSNGGDEVEETETDGAAISIADDYSNRKKVIVTNLSDTFETFHAQEVSDGPKIEEMLNRMRAEVKDNPPISGSYKAKKGDLVMAKFIEDGQWYRAKVEKVSSDGQVSVIYIDYGNRETVKPSDIAQLPPGFNIMPAAAKEYAFAFVLPDKDDEFLSECREEFLSQTNGKILLLKPEYKHENFDAVTLIDEETKKDVILELIREGFCMFDVKSRRSGRLAVLYTKYKDAQDSAKKEGLNIWKYGDISPDDAKEFGFPSLR